VKFKTTCAAFINSDIRIAQQQGQGRDNILAGLVYAIAENYLSKVKGQRPVGKKVLLQGGVAEQGGWERIRPSRWKTDCNSAQTGITGSFGRWPASLESVRQSHAQSHRS
jgi:activator of 2-hydroxyglutaryl-CoA dehydratase